MKTKKIAAFLCISIIMLVAGGNVFSQESTELRMPEIGISMQALLHIFNFEVGDAEELGFVYAGDNDWWQGRQPLPEGFRYQFYVFNNETRMYGAFATDETSPDRTRLHFFHQRDRYIDDFYSETVPEIVWFNPNDPFVFLTEDFRLIENFYAELSNQFLSLQVQRDQALSRFEQAREERIAAMARVQELEETDEAYAEAVAELESKNMELLHALSELDTVEYELEALHSRIRELETQVDTLEEENEELKELVSAQETIIAELEELKDPYKIWMLDLDREGITPYLNLRMGLDNPDARSSANLVPFVDAEIGMYLSNERTGKTYALLSLGSDINTNGEYGFRPQMLISLPNEVFQAGVRGNIGTSGYESYIYERTQSGFTPTVNPFAAVNVVGRDSRAGIEGGIEVSTNESATAYYLNFSYFLNPIHFPWLTFAVERLSFANLVGSDIEGSMFRTEAGFDINWSAGSDIDPRALGYTHTWFFRLAYQVETDSIANRVTDSVGFIVGLTLSFK